MISAILAAKALKKLRGGEMFTTGARPFNSSARQLYGGWTPDEAQATGNLWALRKAYAMRAKYSTDKAEALAARQWMRAYNKTRKEHPTAIRVAMTAGRKMAGLGRYMMKPLSKQQKDAILNYWEAIPLNDRSALAAYKRKLVSNAPYPPYGFLIANPLFSNPEQDVSNVLAEAQSADQIQADPFSFFPDKETRRAFIKANPNLAAMHFSKGVLGEPEAWNLNEIIAPAVDLSQAPALTHVVPAVRSGIPVGRVVARRGAPLVLGAQPLAQPIAVKVEGSDMVD